MRSVYLIRGNDGKYKIGLGNNPKKRLKQIQTGNPDRLTIIETYKSDNASKIESTLHKHYAYARNVGEWFDLSVEDEAGFIERCKRIDNVINYLEKSNNSFI